MSTCIEVSNLTKSFHGRTVVDGLSFRVQTGEVFGLLGHNGAGKSCFSIGLLMASLCRTVKAANAVTGLVYFPMLFLSGATIPFELFPDGLQKVAAVLPLTRGIKLMKAVSLGIQPDAVWKIVVLLGGITLVCSLISVRTFRWE